MRHKKTRVFRVKAAHYARESPTYLSKTRRQQPEIAKKQPEDQSVSRSSGCCIEWKRTAALRWCGKSAPGGVGRPFVRLHTSLGRLARSISVVDIGSILLSGRLGEGSRCGFRGFVGTNVGHRQSISQGATEAVLESARFCHVAHTLVDNRKTKLVAISRQGVAGKGTYAFDRSGFGAHIAL